MHARTFGLRNASIILLACTAIAACTTTRMDYQRDLQSYVGDSEAALAKRLGPAEQRIERTGATILVYRPISYQVPLAAPAPIIAGDRIVTAIPPANTVAGADQTFRADCQVYFSVKQGIIQSWSAQGPECPKTLLERSFTPPD